MDSAHGGEHAVDDTSLIGLAISYLPLILLGGTWVGYLLLAAKARRRQGWHSRRTIAFTIGVVVLGIALSPAFDGFADGDFSGHAAQHMLLAMIAPLALVLATPVTLLLRTLPHSSARRLGSFLNSRTAHVLTNPVTALALSSGGLVVVYFTPLYQLSSGHTGVHLLLHVHFVLSGFLFAWVIAGLDPAPRRARVRTRLIVLGVAIIVHSSVSQLLYAGLLVQVREPALEMQAAGNLMYFGGDIAELLLALVLLLTTRADPAGRPSRAPGPHHGIPAGYSPAPGA